MNNIVKLIAGLVVAYIAFKVITSVVSSLLAALFPLVGMMLAGVGIWYLFLRPKNPTDTIS